jgi:hypothetical protein
MTFLKAYSGNVIPRDQLHLEDGATIAVSPTGDGILRYNDTTKTFQVSIDGAAYVDIGGGGAPGGPGMGSIFANIGNTAFAAPGPKYILGADQGDTEGQGSGVVPAAGSFQNLFVQPNSNNITGAPLIVTVRVAGVATALTVSIPPSTNLLVSNTADVVAAAPGDIVSIEVAAPGAGGSIRSLAIGVQFVV